MAIAAAMGDPGPGTAPAPLKLIRSPEDIFADYRGRHAGIVKALTTDVEKLYEQCDPEKENLCLYGLPNETWAVSLPAEEVPPELPEPALGINFAREGMADKDWLSLVAVHSDSWLLSVAFYFATRFGFDKEARRQLFVLINDLPTVFEAVIGGGKKQPKTPNSNSNSKNKSTPNSNSKNKSGSKASKQSNSKSKPAKQPPPKLEEPTGKDDGDDEDAYLCGFCGDSYANGAFWIGCDVCEQWFHGKCVRITPTKAEHIKEYKCPNCSNKRSRE